MTIVFYKYQGTGNDFVLLDQRVHQWIKPGDSKIIERLCDRKFGIGADGLILLQNKAGYDFEMIYFNADGFQGSMCGNGGRCVVAFAKHLGLIESACHFIAVDGPHDAKVRGTDWVELKMMDVSSIQEGDGHCVLDTGSPHFVTFVEDIDDIDVVKNGSAIRYSKRFREKGINVNFVEEKEGGLIVATYERGVEDETLSCGTGVTAAALAWSTMHPLNKKSNIAITAKGGELEVRFNTLEDGSYNNIWLCGKAELVFKGEINVM